MDRFWFFIYSATLCLLIGEISPFTFKVIIDRYVFNPILQLFSGVSPTGTRARWPRGVPWQ